MPPFKHVRRKKVSQLELSVYAAYGKGWERLLKRKALTRLILFPMMHFLSVDPIQTTFRGGRLEPLHNWYSYLEGYSPDFVEYLLKQFAPNATRILDPFSGTGTTPLTASRFGLEAFYCELNPMLQLLTETKTFASSLEEAERRSLAARLVILAGELKDLADASRLDATLQKSYGETFGKSLFFNEDVFIDILKTRTFIDELTCTDPASARLLSVAVLSSLIPASRLIRRGDVRFKTTIETERGQEKFFPSVQRNLEMIAADLIRLKTAGHSALLVSGDARDLERLPCLDVEAVVTSPPYLNGTNYFRNTKVELWFLRCLRTAQDLSDFRSQAVTSGINDVTVGKPIDFSSDNLAALVEKLEASAYDTRIPRMVATYFSDMQRVFMAVKKHLVKNALMMIDIGDSSYSNVHVPTHSILKEVLEDQGFVVEREIILRRRMSRSGFPLSQVLLCARLPKRRSERICEAVSAPLPSWTVGWREFKTDLPHQKGEYAKRNWGNGLHSLCSYQGKMKPSLASHLVATFVPAGGTVLDPFAGVGTIPFEAALQGKHSWAFDISPAALCITTAKIGKPEERACERQMNSLEAFLISECISEEELRMAEDIHFNGQLHNYFDAGTFAEILLSRRFFLTHPPQNASEALVMASLLHILHGNRPYALSPPLSPHYAFCSDGTGGVSSIDASAQGQSRAQSAHFLPCFVLPRQYLRPRCDFLVAASGQGIGCRDHFPAIFRQHKVLSR